MLSEGLDLLLGGLGLLISTPLGFYSKSATPGLDLLFGGLGLLFEVLI